MKLIAPSLTDRENISFGGDGDVLQREKYGTALLGLVKSSEDRLVISIDGKWGEGKSTFVKMWQNQLDSENIKSIYIDAFKNDFAQDAFIAITSQIVSFADKNINDKFIDKLSDLKNTAKKVGWNLVKFTTKLAVKAATMNIISNSDIAELKDLKSDIAKGTSNLAEKVIEENINSHAEQLNQMEEFKKLLSSLPSHLKDNNGNPLVIIIDELDRCKPTFAVEIIEKIKHLFSVKNVIFVLVMNKEQLEESIKCVYGAIDAHTYLQKFINLEFTIPKKVSDVGSGDFEKYFEKLILLHDFPKGSDDDICVYMKHLNSNYSFSLRQLEKIFTNIAILSNATSNCQGQMPELIAFLSTIKVMSPKIFNKIANNKISFSDLKSEVGSSHFGDNRNHPIYYMYNLIEYCLLPDNELQELNNSAEQNKQKVDAYRGIEVEIRHSGNRRSQLIPLYCQYLNMITVT